MYRMTVRKKGALIVALLVIFTTALLAGLILLQQQNQRADEMSDHSKQVLASARQLLWELVNAETGMRGYIISNNPIFLEPYDFAIKNVNSTRKRLQDLCANNPEQLEIAKRMEASIADFLAYHESNKRLIESNKTQTVTEYTQRADGKRKMDGLRLEVQKLLTIQEQIDDQATNSSLTARSKMRWLLYVGLFLNLVVAGVMHRFLKQNITDRITQLIENNRLAAEGKPLRPPMAGGDELSDLDAQFCKLWQDNSIETTRALNVYAKELERSNRDLQDFASVASHDLQEPLRKIMAFGSRLEGHLGDTLDDKGRDYLQRMRNAAQRMSSLNESLLQLSRVRSKAGTVEAVALESVLLGVLSDLQELISTSGGTVRVGDLPLIWADRTR
jgi:CHASE3 domain sensor protein